MAALLQESADGNVRVGSASCEALASYSASCLPSPPSTTSLWTSMGLVSRGIFDMDSDASRRPYLPLALNPCLSFSVAVRSPLCERLPQFPSPLLLAHHGGPRNRNQQESVCTSDIYLSQPFADRFLVASLEDAINSALKNYFPRLEPTSNVRVEFYNKFQHEADEYDRDFLQQYTGDLDTTLIFVGPFFSYVL